MNIHRHHLFLFVFVAIDLCFAITSLAAHSPVAPGDEITVTGKVTEVHEVDLDKSGNNPEILLFIRLFIPSGRSDNGRGVAKRINLTGKKDEIVEVLGHMVRVGEWLAVEGRVYAIKPVQITIRSIRTIDEE